MSGQEVSVEERREAAKRVPEATDLPLIEYLPNFLGLPAADRAFTALLAELSWERHVMRARGREIPVPRAEVWVADRRYSYSGRVYEPHPWTPTLLALKAAIEGATGAEFNSVLANRYEDGNDSVGWHADDEPEMSPAHPIASLSLGATRTFQMRRGSGRIHSLSLPHGSLLLMRAGMQQEWRHQLPKTQRSCGRRINLTFRYLLAT